jgi:hypothetical protein
MHHASDSNIPAAHRFKMQVRKFMVKPKPSGKYAPANIAEKIAQPTLNFRLINSPN